ncbi:hypothetical protein GRF59_18765 [Paenibacillus sp. HJL G12]|uniref:YcaO domain-containing protein n=1 Tax=Paenibacillus dendrobii TaxID=2691084 RepID=A0A7X3IKJ8_9BACL|nr:YcaO-like family protein [Paenibacillus dendrobii]MWV45659.1 hypothetical protein [Paenibacillus dendrobii]
MIGALTLEDTLRKRESWTVLDIGEERLPCFITYGDRAANAASPKPRHPRFAMLHVDAHECIIGPVFQYEEMGCPDCFLKRKATNLRDHEYRLGNAQSLLFGDVQMDVSLVLAGFRMLLGNAGHSGRLDYYRLDGREQMKRLSYWPAERCDRCSEGAPPDDARAFESAFREQLMYAYGDSYRKEDTRFPEELFSPDNADSNFIVYKDRNTQSFFSVSTFFRVGREEKYGIGIGSTTDYKSSERKSLFEALERYAGMHPRGRERWSIWASYEGVRQSGRHAIDPTVFIDDVTGTASSLITYTADQVLPWINAYSWNQRQAVYIPESLAYYKMDQGYKGARQRVYKGNSNGNALGTGILDSVYYACLELIERDAFLNHWYLRHTPAGIKLESIGNERIRYMIGRLELLGYSVKLFDITMDTGIPVIWALCLGQSRDQFAAYCTSAAHPDPEKAVLNALEEMLLAMEYYDTHTDEIREKAKRIRQEGVREVEDHPILYYLQEERHHFDFLFDSRMEDFRERFAEDYEKLHHCVIDLAEETAGLLDRLSNLFGDVLLVRQTPEGYTHIGLEAVKVLIPHLQQLWFGEEHRVLSMKRLQAAALFWERPMGDIQLAPHPFP